ncbi:MAG: hypothetical protein ACYTFM_06080 [Planctomycetota bacterium]|jgi:hypothetical protein
MATLKREIDRLKNRVHINEHLKIADDTPDAMLALTFYECLIKIIVPKDQSDMTCFRNIGNWLAAEYAQGDFSRDIFNIVLSFAREAAKPQCRNPAAVFVTILKKELGYLK